MISHSETIEMFPEVTVEYLIATVVLETSILIMLNAPPLINTVVTYYV